MAPIMDQIVYIDFLSNHRKNLMGKALFLVPFYRWENQGSERLPYPSRTAEEERPYYVAQGCLTQGPDISMCYSSRQRRAKEGRRKVTEGYDCD